LIEDDFFKIEYHRGYIGSHLRQPGQRSAPFRQDNQDILQGYRRYASSSIPEVSDIGYYGLGYFYSLQTDYERARENFQKVRKYPTSQPEQLPWSHLSQDRSSRSGKAIPRSRDPAWRQHSGSLCKPRSDILCHQAVQ
jgi:hypothetical protein